MADQKNSNDTSTDKSIDDLLQEYAGDVKSNDLDDFLKNDDAFESDDVDAGEDNEKIMAESGGKSGGFLTMMFIVLAFGAAGAGAYVYMNKDEGMTSIMGGFDAPAQTADAQIDVAPEVAPSMPAPIETSPAPSTEELAQPTPIVNDEAPSADTLAMPEMSPPETAALVAEAPAPSAAPALESMPAPTAPATTDASASQAVDAWQSGNDMPPAVTDASAPLPEKAVGEVKAKPPVKAAAKKEEPKEDVKAAEAEPAKKKREYSTMDDALSPPFVAIQEEKKQEKKPEAKAAPKAEPKTAEAAPAAKTSVSGKMAPVLETASAPAPSARNQNESDVTKATGDTAKLIAQGGGKIDLPVSGGVSGGTSAVPAPVSANMAPVAAAPAEPEMRTTALAISGGRSMPDGTVVQTRTYAQMPTTNQATDQGATPAAAAPVAEPVVEAPSAPGRGQTAQEMEAEEAKAVGFVKAAPPASVTQVKAPEVTAAPAATASSGNSETDAKAVIAQAMAAEKSGDKQGALALFQKALEVDAVYGNGNSIDRGMVYDRIGNLRAGS